MDLDGSPACFCLFPSGVVGQWQADFDDPSTMVVGVIKKPAIRPVLIDVRFSMLISLSK